MIKRNKASAIGKWTVTTKDEFEYNKDVYTKDDGG